MIGLIRRPDAETMRAFLPVIGLVAICIGILAYRPNAASYAGVNLLLNYAVPVVFAAYAQMFVIVAGDIDLSIGNFVSLVTCITAAVLPQYPALGALALAALVLAYAGIGVLIHLRRLPSIVVTLGFSFVWLGIAVLILPRPGGEAPSWLAAAVRFKTAFLPLPVWIMIALSVLGYLLLQRWSFGTVLRGVGGNRKAVARAGWSVVRAKAVLYGLAGIFGVLSGMLLTGITTSGDANLSPSYTLLSVAAVILGGGEFVGGKVSPVGTVIGAVTLVLANSLLAFMHIGSDWQLAGQGFILVAVLASRAAISRGRIAGAPA